VLRLLSLPVRRGPATEAQACYQRLDPALPASPSPAIDADGNALHPERADPPNQ
jgi:ribosome-associated heat shock protein Hsp15